MATEITRSEFMAMDPRDRVQLLRDRTHTIVNDPPKQREPHPEGAILRSAFNGMSHAERVAALKAGKVVVND